LPDPAASPRGLPALSHGSRWRAGERTVGGGSDQLADARLSRRGDPGSHYRRRAARAGRLKGSTLRSSRRLHRSPPDYNRACFARLSTGTGAGRLMIVRIFTAGGFPLVSRVTGFFRDVMRAAVLGAGPVADAFFVALRLPNHFRAIFAEGAFNAAFVPAYARIREQGGRDAAQLFADRVFTILVGCVGFLVLLALVFTPAVISLLAPGFSADPGRFALALELTRITFPYLLLMSLVTLYGGILNSLARFAAAAAAPILLNLSMIATLFVAVFFPTPGHAAAWGVFIAGILEVLLVGGDTLRNGVMTAFRWPKWDEDVKRFFHALG